MLLVATSDATTCATCAEIMIRLCVASIGFLLLGWGGAGFGAIREKCVFACDEPAGLYAGVVPIAYVLMLGTLPATASTLGARVVIRVAACLYLYLMWSAQFLGHLENVGRVGMRGSNPRQALLRPSLSRATIATDAAILNPATQVYSFECPELYESQLA